MTTINVCAAIDAAELIDGDADAFPDGAAEAIRELVDRRITMTPRQLATLHAAVSLDGRDGRKFALIALEQDDDGALLVQQGIHRQRIEHGRPAEDLDDAAESTS